MVGGSTAEGKRPAKLRLIPYLNELPEWIAALAGICTELTARRVP